MQDSPILRNFSTGDILTAFPTYADQHAQLLGLTGGVSWT